MCCVAHEVCCGAALTRCIVVRRLRNAHSRRAFDQLTDELFEKVEAGFACKP